MEVQMNLIEAIKARHSVRAYLDKKIEADKVEKLNELIAKCNEEGNLHLQLLEDAGNTFNRVLSKVMGLGSAVSVIACVGKDDATLDERVGYYGEKVVLLAQQLGLNTCWAGTYNAKNVPAKIEAGERLSIVIAIGYGANQGKQHKSKSYEQVSSVSNAPEWFKTGVEMALLAPTAINQQKFEIKLNGDAPEFIDKGGILSKVDLGIIRCHFEIGANSVKGE